VAALRDLIAYAAKFEGVPYVYGGTTPKGFDCSGYTQYVFGHYGLKLPRTSQEQAKAGIGISASDLSPGDLIFSDWGEGPDSHVAIYAGAGKLLEAPRTGETVHLIDFNSGYKAHVNGYRRVTSKQTGVLDTVSGISPNSSLSDALGGLITWPGDILGFFKDATDSVSSVASFFGAFFQPSTYVRIGAGVFGMVFLLAGCIFLIVGARQS
jgi:hypothetical protein